jgi:hypothetical protein
LDGDATPCGAPRKKCLYIGWRKYLVEKGLKAAKLPITKPRYGHFESHPARYTSHEAWVLLDASAWRDLGAARYEELFTGISPWVEFNASEVLYNAGMMSKKKFETAWGYKLPPLPKHAFTKSWR